MKPQTKKMLHYAAIFMVGALGGMKLSDMHVTKVLDGVYQYDVEVSVIDANTGQAIDNMTVESPPVSSSDLFQQTGSMFGGRGGVMRLKGIAYEPQKWIFGCKGYENSTIEIDQDTSQPITVKLNLNH